MNEFQRLFLLQGRSDFVVFELLRDQQSLPPCHALHYLQMATELLGKAQAWKFGPNYQTHRAFVGFLRSLNSNRKAQARLGFRGKNEQWESLIRSCLPFAREVENLAPSLTQDGPNPEYPWPRANPVSAPAEYRFDLWKDLEEHDGRQFLKLLTDLFASAEAYL